ncbi:MAG: hypothetical protein RL308_2634 [Bacteroidota bacterium]|jgi:hypothetical protein
MKNNTKIGYSIAIVLFQMQMLFAQAPNFGDNVEDVSPAAPIDTCIAPMALIGLCIVFFLIKNKVQSVVK